MERLGSCSGLSVADVYSLFLFHGDAPLPIRESGQELDQHVLNLLRGVRENLTLSVEQLFEQTTSEGK